MRSAGPLDQAISRAASAAPRRAAADGAPALARCCLHASSVGARCTRAQLGPPCALRARLWQLNTEPAAGVRGGLRGASAPMPGTTVLPLAFLGVNEGASVPREVRRCSAARGLVGRTEGRRAGWGPSLPVHGAPRSPSLDPYVPFNHCPSLCQQHPTHARGPASRAAARLQGAGGNRRRRRRAGGWWPTALLPPVGRSHRLPS